MHPQLFEIPLIHRPMYSFGPTMVIGFLLAFLLVKRLSRSITSNPQEITNIAVCCLIAGVVGARAFYVIHHFGQLQGRLSSVFAIWRGGLEFYGGVIVAVPVIVVYLWRRRLPVRRYLDILTIGLMLGLVFGRLGCFLNGCCYGKPSSSVYAVRFPYDSFAYHSQVNPDLRRNRAEPRLEVPAEYFAYVSERGTGYLKPFQELTSEQQFEVTKGKYRCLRVHPTQLYSSANAAALCFVLYLFWRRSQRSTGSGNTKRLLTQPGPTFGLAFILYGITRFLLEFLRDDNPFEYAWWAVYKGGTVSQNLGIYMVVLGVVLMITLQRMKAENSRYRSK